MIRSLFRLAASLLLLAAGSIFIAGFAALGFASFLLTCPLVWGSPAKRRVRATMELAAAFMAFVSTMPSPRAAMDAVNLAHQAAMSVTQEPPDEGA